MYNTIIWCPLYQNAVHRIEKIQRKFIKFACYKCHIHFDRNNYDYFIHHRFRPIVRLYFLDYSDNSIIIRQVGFSDVFKPIAKVIK
jgi:transposase-like protein